VPVAKAKCRINPLVLSVVQVPVVSPAIVIVFFSHVLALSMVYSAIYDLANVLLCSVIQYVPVRFDLTQNDTVIVLAFAVPNSKCAALYPSIGCL
jgi:hypothetical protein